MKASEVMGKVKAVVLDMDGTLIDSIYAWEQVDVLFFGKRGLQYDRKQHIQEITGLNMNSCAAHVISKYQLQETPEAVIDEWNSSYDVVFQNKISFIPSAQEFLQFLIQKRIPFGIASASPRRIFDLFFDRYPEIKQHIACFVSCDDVQKNKPDPAVFAEAIRRLNANPDEVLIVEDSVTGLKGAKAAAVAVVACILSEPTKLVEKQQFSDVVISSFAELME